MPFNDDLYDAIYCYNTLHLFLREERIKILKKCYNQLNANGFVFFVVFSDKEKSYGKGKEIEDNTYESKPGRPTHYFTDEDIIEHFKDFLIIETGIMVDQENHGETVATTTAQHSIAGEHVRCRDVAVRGDVRPRGIVSRCTLVDE